MAAANQPGAQPGSDSARRDEKIREIKTLVREAMAPAADAAKAALAGQEDRSSLLGLSKRESVDLWYRQQMENAYLVDRMRLARSMISMAQYLPATSTSAAVTEAAIASTKLALSVCPKRQDVAALGVPPKPPKPPLWVDPRPLVPGADVSRHKEEAKAAWPRVLAAAKRLCQVNKRSRSFVEEFLHEPQFFALTQFAFDWSGGDHREETRCYLDVLYPPDCHVCKKTPVVEAGGEANRCNRCRKVWYCSLACAKKDWKQHLRPCPMPE